MELSLMPLLCGIFFIISSSVKQTAASALLGERSRCLSLFPPRPLRIGFLMGTHLSPAPCQPKYTPPHSMIFHIQLTSPTVPPCLSGSGCDTLGFFCCGRFCCGPDTMCGGHLGCQPYVTTIPPQIVVQSDTCFTQPDGSQDCTNIELSAKYEIVGTGFSNGEVEVQILGADGGVVWQQVVVTDWDMYRQGVFTVDTGVQDCEIDPGNPGSQTGSARAVDLRSGLVSNVVGVEIDCIVVG